MNASKTARVEAHACVLAVVVWMAAAAPVRGQEREAPAAMPARVVRCVRVVYFTPADREPLSGYRERLDRILTDVQGFYRREMERNGFGPRTFPLERDENRSLAIHVVKSTRTYQDGADAGSDDVRHEVRQALLADGIDIDQEHVLIFQNLLLLDGNAIRSAASYTYGGLGDHRSGTAWVTDHPLEDVVNLAREEPVLDAHGRKLPLCDYVVAEMGGIAHELGHAFGLPHDRETSEQRKTLGTALMGNGNYEYGREQTPKGGKGAFLSAAEAAVLSSHPLFTSGAVDLDTPLACELEEIDCSRRNDQLVFTGKVKSNVRPCALVAYHDPLLVGMDYDATGWVSSVDVEGRFEVRVGELEPGPYELRLRCCLENGAQSTIAFQYTLGASLDLPPRAIVRQLWYHRYVDAGREARLGAMVLQGLEKLAGEDDRWYRKARIVFDHLTRKPEPLQSLAAVGDGVQEVGLDSIQWDEARVQGEEPAHEGTSVAVPMESAERVHEHGLRAHASSSYAYRLGGRWRRFESFYALQNWTSGGSVVFVIKCDGAERLRSPVVRSWNEQHVALDLTGVDRLELIVEDAGDGEWDDDASWLSPRLAR